MANASSPSQPSLGSFISRVSRRLARGLRWAPGLVEMVTALAVASCLFFYPAWQSLRTVASSEVRQHARPPDLASSFEGTSARYVGWAEQYLASKRAAHVHENDVAATEWPMFGSVFLLLAAEELTHEGSVELRGDVKRAVDLAARVIVHPATGTWVRAKWGESYLEEENVFYRMLMILGLEAHARITGNSTHRALLRTQARSLGEELFERPHALADDYPGECYPNDVLWAVAALRRAARAGHWDRGRARELGQKLVSTLRGPANTKTGLPAFAVTAATAEPTQVARGSANSGLLCMAAEVDRAAAVAWFGAYADHYFEGDGVLWGFREMPRGQRGFSDVDSGPVIGGVGTVATGFGIGAARSVGRYDIAAPLVMQTVATSWPTPFGLLLPGTLGWASAEGWCFGELALHFAMTRPNRTGQKLTYDGPAPPTVWIVVALYLVCGFACLGWAFAAGRRAAGNLSSLSGKSKFG